MPNFSTNPVLPSPNNNRGSFSSQGAPESTCAYDRSGALDNIKEVVNKNHIEMRLRGALRRTLRQAVMGLTTLAHLTAKGTTNISARLSDVTGEQRQHVNQGYAENSFSRLGKKTGEELKTLKNLLGDLETVNLEQVELRKLRQDEQQISDNIEIITTNYNSNLKELKDLKKTRIDIYLKIIPNGPIHSQTPLDPKQLKTLQDELSEVEENIEEVTKELRQQPKELAENLETLHSLNDQASDLLKSSTNRNRSKLSSLNPIKAFPKRRKKLRNNSNRFRAPSMESSRNFLRKVRSAGLKNVQKASDFVIDGVKNPSLRNGKFNSGLRGTIEANESLKESKYNQAKDIFNDEINDLDNELKDIKTVLGSLENLGIENPADSQNLVKYTTSLTSLKSELSEDKLSNKDLFKRLKGSADARKKLNELTKEIRALTDKVIKQGIDAAKTP